MKKRFFYPLFTALITAVLFVSCVNGSDPEHPTVPAEQGTVTDALTDAPTYNEAEAAQPTELLTEVPTEVQTEPETAPHVHTFDEWTVTTVPTCTEEGMKTRTCACGETETQTIDAAGHDRVEDYAVTPTCTETGLTQGEHCSVCGAIIVKQNTIPAKGHSLITEKGIPATCTADGLSDAQYCSVCGIYTKEATVIPAAHMYKPYDRDAEVVVCTECGIYSGSCGVGERYRDSSWTFTPQDGTMTFRGDAPIGAFYYDKSDHCSQFYAQINRIVFADDAELACESFYACDSHYVEEIIAQRTLYCGEESFKGFTVGRIECVGEATIGYNAFSEITADTICCQKGISTYMDSFCCIDVDTLCISGTSDFSFCSAEGICVNRLAFGPGTHNIRIAFDYSSIKTMELLPGCVVNAEPYYNDEVVCMSSFYGTTIRKISIDPDSSINLNGLLIDWEDTTIDCNPADTRYIRTEHYIIENGTLIWMDDYNLIPNDGSVTGLGNRLFTGTNHPGIIVVPNGVTHIDDWCFDYAGDVSVVILPDSITEISETAFIIGRFHLYNEYYPMIVCAGNDFEIPYRYYYDGKWGCDICGYTDPYSAEFSFSSNGNGTCSVTGLVSFRGNDLYIPSMSPDGDVVTAIADNAFENKTMCRVIIPSTVQAIGKYAFSGCTKLQGISLPDSVSKVDIFAFKGCSSLRFAALSKGMNAVLGQVFYHCTALEQITIPSSVKSIGNYAFSQCSSLQTILYDGDEAEWERINISAKGNEYVTSSKVICCTAAGMGPYGRL